MNLPQLGALNLKRNLTRSVLTVLGVGVAVLTFLLLRTVVYSYSVMADSAAADRVVTRHKVTFVMTIPLRYAEDVRQLPGVQHATWANWWGGKNPQMEQEFFGTLAVDPGTFFQVYDEMVVPPDQLAAWKEDRQGAIVGDVLARKMGWKVGDSVHLVSAIFPGEYTFNIRGIYEATRKSVDKSQFLFHWKYMNDSLPTGFPTDQIGWIVSRVAPGAGAAETGRRIDALFDQRDIQTLSQDESTFNKSFLAMFEAVLDAMDLVSVAIVAILMLILGNTIAIGVRERTAEYGVLRAMGFLPRHLAILVLGEAVTLGILGGLLGLALAYPIVQVGLGGFIEENMGAWFPYFRITLANAGLAMLLAMLLAAAGGLLPARTVARLRVVDALRRIA